MADQDLQEKYGHLKGQFTQEQLRDIFKRTEKGAMESPGVGRSFLQGVTLKASDEIEGAYKTLTDPKDIHQGNVQAAAEDQRRKDQAILDLEPDRQRAVMKQMMDAGLDDQDVLDWLEDTETAAKMEIKHPLKRTWRTYQKAAEALDQEVASKYPTLSMGTEIAGGILPSLIPGVGLAGRLAQVGKWGKTLAGTGLGAVEGFTHGFFGSEKEGMEALDDGGTGAMIGSVSGALPGMGAGLINAGKKVGRQTISTIGKHKRGLVKEALENPYATPGRAPSVDMLARTVETSAEKVQKQVRTLNRESRAALSAEKNISVKDLKKKLEEAGLAAKVARIGKETTEGTPAKTMLGRTIKEGTPSKTVKKTKFMEPGAKTEYNLLREQLGEAAEKGKVSQKDLKAVLDLSRDRSRYTGIATSDKKTNTFLKTANEMMNKTLKRGNPKYKHIMNKPGGHAEKTANLSKLEKRFDLEDKVGRKGYNVGNNTLQRIDTAIKKERKIPDRKLLKNLEKWSGDKNIVKKFEATRIVEDLTKPIPHTSALKSAALLTGRAIGYGTAGITGGLGPKAIAAMVATGEGLSAARQALGRDLANKMIRIAKSKGPKAASDFLKKHDVDLHASRGLYRGIGHEAHDMSEAPEGGTYQPMFERDIFKEWMGD